MLSGSSPYIFGVCNTHSSFDQPGQSAWIRQQKGDPTATLCTEKPSPSLESQAIASCIAAKLSGCLTAISIDCRARIPVVPLAKWASSVSWMSWSGCRPTAMPLASGGAHSDLGTSADCVRSDRRHRKDLRFFDEETPSPTGFQ